MSDSLRPRGLQEPTRLLCPWDSPNKNTGEGFHFLLQEICLTGIEPEFSHLLHWQADSLPLLHVGSWTRCKIKCSVQCQEYSRQHLTTTPLDIKLQKNPVFKTYVLFLTAALGASFDKLGVYLLNLTKWARSDQHWLSRKWSVGLYSTFASLEITFDDYIPATSATNCCKQWGKNVSGWGNNFELILIFLVLLSMLVIIFASFSQGFIQNPPTLDEVP